MTNEATTQQATPPARLSEKVFRRHEDTLFKVIDNFPGAFEFIADKPNAFACTLRSAMKSLYQYKWETKIPIDHFMRLYEAKEIVVRELSGRVRIGSKETTRERVIVKDFALSQESGLIIKPHGEERLKIDVKNTAHVVLCSLAAEGVLNAPILLSGLTVEAATELLQSFDIVLEKTGTPNEWLLS